MYQFWQIHLIACCPLPGKPMKWMTIQPIRCWGQHLAQIVLSPKKIKSRNWNKINQKSLPFCGFHNWWCCTVHDSHETRCDDDDGDVDGRGVGRRRRSRAVAAAELELLEQLLEQPFLFGQKFRGQRTRHYSRKHGIVAKATSRTLRCLPSRSQFQGKQVVNHHFLNQWNYSLVSFEKDV